MTKTVGELVKQLQKLPPDSEIWVATCYGFHPIDEADEFNRRTGYEEYLLVYQIDEEKFRLVIDDQEAVQPQEFYDNSWSIFEEE